jgi:hypothetical protein
MADYFCVLFMGDGIKYWLRRIDPYDIRMERHTEIEREVFTNSFMELNPS